jgi:hypothetical protein
MAPLSDHLAGNKVDLGNKEELGWVRAWVWCFFRLWFISVLVVIGVKVLPFGVLGVVVCVCRFGLVF